MSTIAELKKVYACKNRNTIKAPYFNRLDEKTLQITEYMIGGTVCYQIYRRKRDRKWEYVKSEC